MPKTMQLEMWAVWDANGDYAVGVDSDGAAEAYRDNIGEPDAATGIRLAKVMVTVPLPADLEITAVVPTPDETPTVTVS